MNAIVEKTDAELKTDVLAELKYEPAVNITDIGVLVKEGAVTLNGFASSFGEKWDAVRATKRVAGVRAIADDIVVKLPSSLVRTDGDIGASAANQISWCTSIPKGKLNILVRGGWITLEGELELGYYKSQAEDKVKYLPGVKGVTNLITIKSSLSAANVQASIEAAFERSALLDAEKIHVETSGHNVTLRGKVRNHAEHDEAERVAWATSGVWSVDNQIDVKWSWGLED
jgi:osmotically-inducible protein OsmY